MMALASSPASDWIGLDEVQRVPKLLDEVHYLMEEEDYKRFVLSGSSARKLKRGGINLLAGRATLRRPIDAFLRRLHGGDMVG